MSTADSDRRFTALNDFYRVRNQALLKEIIARFSGKSTELLSYEEVRQKLKAYPGSVQGIKDIPLNAIIGSVGRYSDFTREFLPRHDINRDRWASIKLAAEDTFNLPPIEVYKLGEAYFVIDGNHRVSVARQNGMAEIPAIVTEVNSRVPLSPDVQPDELILKAELAQFLENTGVDLLIPEARLDISTPGTYPVLEEHIALHRQYMQVEQQREVSFDEAIKDWYGHVYLPIVQNIRDSGILRYFPGRTETDLYLWISDHKDELEEQLGWHIQPESALLDIVSQYTPAGKNIFNRVGARLLELSSLSTLEPGPRVGLWRWQTQEIRRENRLFLNIIVPHNGTNSGWIALEQAISIATKENASLLGLHVIPSEEQRNHPDVTGLQVEFEERCSQAGVHGHLAIEVGTVSDVITKRAHVADLVVTSLNYPPGNQARARLGSGFRELVQRCPRPVLAVPRTPTSLASALLAYDGSPKADEALYIAAYLASYWNISLRVTTVFEGDRIEPETLMRAQVYLEEQNIEASYSARKGPIAETILDEAQGSQVDLILTGGYGLNPFLELVFGSTLDFVLRGSQVPVLICR